LGSVREMTNGSGAIQAQLAYDSFGRVTHIQGSLAPDFQFGGYYFHAPSGLSLTQTRTYNPALAVWLSRDPKGEITGANLTSYAMGDPVSHSDPSGLDWVKLTLAPVSPGIGHVGLVVNCQSRYYTINGFFVHATDSPTSLRVTETIDVTLSEPDPPYVAGPFWPASYGPEVPGGGCKCKQVVDQAKRIQKELECRHLTYTAWPGLTGSANWGTSNQVVYSILTSAGLPTPAVPMLAPGYNIGPLGLPSGY
jgi:RHS repeat-associated protein